MENGNFSDYATVRTINFVCNIKSKVSIVGTNAYLALISI